MKPFNPTLSVLVLLAWSGTGYAQWKVVRSSFVQTAVLYTLAEEDLKRHDGYYFPEYDLKDQPLTGAYRLSRRPEAVPFSGVRGPVLSWKKKFASPVTCHLDSTWLFHRIYTQNISHYQVYLRSPQRQGWYVHTYQVAVPGYQIPQREKVAEWVAADTSRKNEDLLTAKLKSTLVDQLMIVAYPAEPGKKADFAVAELVMSNFKTTKMDFDHPFFDRINGRTAVEELETNSLLTIPSAHVRLSSLANYSFFNEGFGNIEFAPLHDKATEWQLLRSLFGEIFDKYPFYAERGIDKQAVLRQFERICPSDMPPCPNVLDSLRTLVSRFNDPHFYLPDPKKKPKTPANGEYPVLLGKFYDKLYVAGLFDTLLVKVVKPGSRILSLGGRPVKAILDSLDRHAARLSLQDAKYLSRYLPGAGGKVEMAVLSGVQDTVEVVVEPAKKLVVPARFRPQHGEFRELEGGVGYFRLNTFQPGDWVRFANHMDRLRELKGIIFDLRNNGGGHGYEAMRIASCFIDKPGIYQHEFFGAGDNDIKESMVLAPNRRFSLKGLNVVILINENTACQSEIFAYFLRKNANAMLLGNHATAGAAAHRQGVTLPNGYQFDFNAMSRLYFPDYADVESKGLIPDVWVTLNKVEDLAPYDDKVLRTAQQLLTD